MLDILVLVPGCASPVDAGHLGSGSWVCESGRCWTSWFWFLGDSLRTRFRWLRDSSSGSLATLLPGYGLFCIPVASLRPISGRSGGSRVCWWSWVRWSSGTGQCWKSLRRASRLPRWPAGMGWRGRRCTGGCGGMPKMGWGGLADRSSRRVSCPHQMPAVTEARIVGMRREHPGWGPSRIRFELERSGVVPLPGRPAVYRALVRHGLVAARKRRRRREDYRRWERPRAMDLWQMDVMGRVFLANGTEVKIVTGIDDHSRFVVCAKAVLRATARAGLPGAEGDAGPARDPGADPHR